MTRKMRMNMDSNLAVFDGSDQALTVGHGVEVTRGALKGATGVLIGFSDTQKCQIELDSTERGVLLVIDAGAVKQRPPVVDFAHLAHVDSGTELQAIYFGRS